MAWIWILTLTIFVNGQLNVRLDKFQFVGAGIAVRVYGAGIGLKNTSRLTLRR
ncbi:hypothetical protein [Klebsiella pneumoniae]|uniref:hypothetical protein n=1 Tax=Klebsiella pneumoniae TaxID=573 RepID=UPI002271385B|nr:hypothetical protein [Klebsiella pneumoniae]MCY0155228.1 hypothetical protein [Klebsiella pneumoniae]